MSMNIVKYSNQFNAQSLCKFNAIHLNLLIAICTKVRDKGRNEVSFSFDELWKLVGDNSYRMQTYDFAQQIIETNRRLLASNFEFEDDGKTVQFALFSKFVTDPKSSTLTVRVNPEFSFLLNDLTSQFTRFELEEFTRIKSKYAKECYRRLKQYRSSGVWVVDIDKFRSLMGTPGTYGTRELSKRVLAPIEEELKPLLDLQIEKIYGARKKLVKLKFTFRAEHFAGGAQESSPQPELEPEQPQPEQPVQEPQPKPQPKPQPEQETLFDEPVKPEIVPTTAGTIDFRRNGYPEDFETLWKTWPRKESKAAAYKAWKKKNLGISHADLLAAARQWLQMESMKGTQPQYLPYLATWINQQRWGDLADTQPHPQYQTPQNLSNAAQNIARIQDPTERDEVMRLVAQGLGMR